MSRVLGVVADSGPVLVLAVIAAAGSFTHIRDTATEHGQGGWMAWAVAVCIDLTCVMAARERQRDKRTGRAAGRLSWPTVVLVGGILLSLAANLAQADPTPWGWISAATPAGAFLVAVSMLERRASTAPQIGRVSGDLGAMTPPPSFGHSSAASSAVRAEAGDGSSPSPSSPPALPEIEDGPRPQITAAVPARTGQHSAQDEQDERDGNAAMPAPSSSGSSSSSPGSSGSAGPLVDFARRVAAEYLAEHGRPITRDALRARLGVSNRLASDLLHQVRGDTA